MIPIILNSDWLIPIILNSDWSTLMIDWFSKDDKKYHMDLKENGRGRFLKVSETFTRGYNRFQVFIPAEGMREFQQNIGELIDEYDNGDADDAVNGPQNKHLRIENKNFYFDIKKNQQGRYMTISEVKGNYRNSILVPESGWEDFRDVLDDYVKQVDNDIEHLRDDNLIFV